MLSVVFSLSSILLTVALLIMTGVRLTDMTQLLLSKLFIAGVGATWLGIFGLMTAYLEYHADPFFPKIVAIAGLAIGFSFAALIASIVYKPYLERKLQRMLKNELDSN